MNSLRFRLGQVSIIIILAAVVSGCGGGQEEETEESRSVATDPVPAQAQSPNLLKNPGFVFQFDK